MNDEANAAARRLDRLRRTAAAIAEIRSVLSELQEANSPDEARQILGQIVPDGDEGTVSYMYDLPLYRLTAFAQADLNQEIEDVEAAIEEGA